MCNFFLKTDVQYVAFVYVSFIYFLVMESAYVTVVVVCLSSIGIYCSHNVFKVVASS